MLILEKIDLFLTVVEPARINASANPDIINTLDTLESTTRAPGNNGVIYRDVFIQRSTATIPGDGYVVNAWAY